MWNGTISTWDEWVEKRRARKSINTEKKSQKCIIDFNLKIMFVVGAFYSGSSSSSQPVDIFLHEKIYIYIHGLDNESMAFEQSVQ